MLDIKILILYVQLSLISFAQDQCLLYDRRDWIWIIFADKKFDLIKTFEGCIILNIIFTFNLYYNIYFTYII